MNLLSIDSSAKTASVAVICDNKIVAQEIVNNGLTHSQTLIPMVDKMLKVTNITCDDIDYYACNTGPGSFTGVRIGVSAVKGLAMKNDTPCIAVSTLESIAMCGKNFEGIVCSVMDARRNQVYNANFISDRKHLVRVTEDRPISIDDLHSELSKYENKVLIVGDGEKVVFDYLSQNDKWQDNFVRYEYPDNVQHAKNTALIALNNLEKSVSPKMLMPLYLRPTQAERELKKKENLL